jgi:site-specific recombinase XerD
MKKEEFFVSEHGPSEAMGECHVNSFLAHLRSKGYAKRTLRKKRSVTTCFVRWATGKQIGLQDLDESHLTAFMHRSDQRTKARVKFELAALQPFLKHLRAEEKVPPPALLINTSPADC